MDNNTRISVARRLAIEKQLLREEMYIVHALKTVKEERFALQREGTDLLCLLKEVLRQGKPRNSQEQDVDEQQVETTQNSTAKTEDTELIDATSTLLDEFNTAALDEGVGNEVELNLTVPRHQYHDENLEEFEENEMDDDFLIEMSMLMNGENRNE